MKSVLYKQRNSKKREKGRAVKRYKERDTEGRTGGKKYKRHKMTRNERETK